VHEIAPDYAAAAVCAGYRRRAHPASICRLRRPFAPGEYAGFGLSSRAGRKKRAVAPPGDYRPISSRLPLVAIHLSAGPANLVSLGFAPAMLDFGETRRISTPRGGAPASSAARHFARGGGRYVETSHPP
jgi:hypothetical protein